jgi:hypothetical protein
MGEWTRARIQLCGRFVADVDGARVEDTLPGRRGGSCSPISSSTVAVQCPAMRC